MDEKRPKRRKDKYNPYTILKSGGKYFLSFEDGQGITHNYEIDRPLFDLFDSFELEDLSYLNEWDRHMEQSELTEESLNRRSLKKAPYMEDTVIAAMQSELLHMAIFQLTEKQRRRLCLYYFAGLSYEKIAELERCHFTSVREAILSAEEKIKIFFKNNP